jgi:translation initiation factor 5A
LAADGSDKSDLKIPEGELGDQIKADFAAGKELTVTVLKAMSQEQIIASKETTK